MSKSEQARLKKFAASEESKLVNIVELAVQDLKSSVLYEKLHFHEIKKRIGLLFNARMAEPNTKKLYFLIGVLILLDIFLALFIIHTKITEKREDANPIE